MEHNKPDMVRLTVSDEALLEKVISVGDKVENWFIVRVETSSWQGFVQVEAIRKDRSPRR